MKSHSLLKSFLCAVLLSFSAMSSAELKYDLYSSASTTPWSWPVTGTYIHTGFVSNLWIGTQDDRNPFRALYTEGYCVRITGYLRITNPGNYYFQGYGGDDQGVMYINGVERWRQTGYIGETSEVSSAVISLGAGLHSIDARMCEGSGGDRLRVRWRGDVGGLDVGTSWEDIPDNRLLTQSPGGVGTTATNTIRGLEYRFYEGFDGDLGGDAGLQGIGAVKNTGFVDRLTHPDDLMVNEDADSMSIWMQGRIYLTANTYRFRFMATDDRAALFINGVQQINQTGTGDSAYANYVVATAGFFNIDVRFSENSGGETVNLRYCTGATCTGMSDIPATWLYQPTPRLAAWFKADAGTNTTTHDATVSSWGDASETGNNLSTVTGTPQYKSNAWNFNPTIDFQDEQMTAGDSAFGLSIGKTARTVIAVVKPSVSGADNGTITGYGRDGTGQHSLRYMDATLQGYNWGSSITAPAAYNFASGVPRLVSFHYENSNVNGTNNARLYRDGTNAAQTSSNAWDVHLNDNADLAVGASPDHASNFNGQIAEIAYYSWDLAGTEFQKVNSYLGIKWGLQLSHNYIDSTGATLWTLGGGYDNEIMGIGRDDASALNQKISQSQINADASRILLDLEGTYAAANNARSVTLADRAFAMTGRDGGAMTWTGTHQAIANKRIARIWKLDTQGSVPNLKVAILKSALPAYGGTIDSLNVLSLIVSSDTTFNNSDTVITLQTCDTNYWCATIPAPADVSYFSFAYHTYLTQTITPTQPTGPLVFNSTHNVSAISSSGLLVNSITASGGCTVQSGGSSNSATILITSGSIPCSVTYGQSGNATYAPASQAGSDITVSGAPQNITFPAQSSKAFVNAGTFNINPVATATSQFVITYSSGSTGVCTVPAGVGNHIVTMVSVGTCIIRANQSGNANWGAATQVAQNISITQGAQAIIVTTPAPSAVETGGSFPVAASASSGQAVSITTSGNCTVPGGSTNSATVTATGSTGTCTVNYTRAAAGNYLAATPVSSNTTVTLLSQAITITQSPSATVALGSSFNVAASSSSGLGVAITVTGGCTRTVGGTNSATVQLTSGTVPCIVHYNQAGNVAYMAAAEKTSMVEAIRTVQSITVGTPAPSSAALNATFGVVSSASSGLPVTITVSSACSITAGGSNTATIRMDSFSNVCTVTYTQAGNDSYKPAVTVTNVVRDATPPVIAQITAVPSPTNNTPEYTFSSNETGTILYGGACSSPTIFANTGNNVVNFNVLAVATYTNCTVRVIDSSGNYSNILAIPAFTVKASVIAYVKTLAAGLGDCSTWANACADIQTAINIAGVNEVWIAKGTYRPASTIVLKGGVGLYGGFTGTESSYTPSVVSASADYENDAWTTNVSYGSSKTVDNLTIISGDTGGDDVVDSRGFVLYPSDIVGTNLSRLFSATNQTVLTSKRIKMSGLILNAANGAATGAGVSVANSYVTIDRTQFIFNQGANGGAAAVTTGGKLEVVDSTFLRNQSTALGGAIVSSDNDTNIVSIYNSTLELNIGGTNGGAVYHSRGTLAVLNSTFFSNSLVSSAGNGGAIDLASLPHPGRASIKYATLVKNSAGTALSATGRGGAINVNTAANAVVRLANSLVLDNTALATTGSNIADMARITDGGYNIVGYNGISGIVTGVNTPYSFVGGTSSTASTLTVEEIVETVLANNGGYTATLKLLEDSYARDLIPDIHADCERNSMIGVDQRGYARPDASGNYCDVGAVEFDVLDPCKDPNRKKGFFIGTYPKASTSCLASGDLNVSVGSVHPFYLVVLIVIGALRLRRYRQG